MRRLALLACLLASAAQGQALHTHIRSGGLSRNFPNKPASAGIALSFLPSGSWTLANDCAGTALSGLTFSRSSSAMCTKRDGSMVLLTSAKPRLQGEGLLMETGSTNVAIRSEAFDNVAWTATNTTVTADSSTAPDGATSADLLHSAVNGGLVESTAGALGGGATWGAASVYLQTLSGTQAFAIALRDTTAGADRCTATGTATTTWTRFYCVSRTVTTGNSHSIRLYPGGTGGTGTVLAWGAQVEAATNATGVSSYVPTAGTSVARTGEFGTITWPLASGQNVNVSAVATHFADANNSAIGIGFTSADFRVCTIFGNATSLAASNWTELQRDSGGYKFAASAYTDNVWTDGTTRKLVIAYTEATKNSVLSIYNGGGSLLGTSTGSAMAENLSNVTQLQFPCISSSSINTAIKDVCVGTGTFCQ